MYQVLIVEDDADLAKITQIYFSKEGYQSDIAGTCEQAQALLQAKEYDLILLDVVLPDARGDALCLQIRKCSNCPIIFISCLDDSSTVINALKSGGDDYMVKPVNYPELLARAEAVIRRSPHQKKSTDSLQEYRYFSVDPVRHQVIRNGETLDLSSIEYSLLQTFLSHPGSLLLYNELYESVWGNDSLGDIRTVMVHISNLRKKLDPDHVGIIQTVRGAGYILNLS